MIKKNVFIIKKRENDGTYTVIFLDYKFVETSKFKIFKKAEKLLKQKIKEEKIDLIEVDIIQIVV